jgi:hypothetical protein
MAISSSSDSATQHGKDNGAHVDVERQLSHTGVPQAVAPPKTLGAGVSLNTRDENIVLNWLQTALAIGVFGTTLTTLSLSLMEWRGVTITNVYVANFFFAAAFGLLVTAQWELSIGNGFAYTVFSAFGKPPLVKQKPPLNKSRALLCWICSYFDAIFWYCHSLR